MKKKIYLFIFILCLLISPQTFAAEQNSGNEGYVSDVDFLKQYQHIKLSVESDNTAENRDAADDDGKNADVRKDFDSLPENSTEDNESLENALINKQIKNTESKLNEKPLLKRLVERNIIRTDIASYLLEDELTFSPKKGPVEKIQFFGAYNGYISSSWSDGDYDTNYTNNFIQVGVMGKFRNTNNDFKFLVNPKGSHGKNYMQNFVADAYITNNSIPHHQVVIGYSRNQIGKEGGSSSYILPFIMRSQIARNFGSTRALGVRLIGSYDLIDYNLAFNSSDRYFRKWFAGPEFTGWVDFKPLGKTNGKYGKLVIGGGLNAGKNGTHYTVGSVYVGYKYKKLWSRFEYGIADGYNGSQVVNKKAEGFYGIVGYKITPKFQVIARYDQFNPDRNISGDTRREYTAGINYFIKGQALKLILNYVFCQNKNMPNSHRIMLGTQILL